MELDKYIWPGGYTLQFVFTQSNEPLHLCHDCATKVDPSKDEYEDYKYVGSHVHWEGESMFCDDCGGEMPSEYGPIEEEKEENDVTKQTISS